MPTAAPRPPLPLRSCFVQSLPHNQTALFLTGTWQGHWQLTLVPLPLPAAPVPLEGVLRRRLPHCPCRALGGLALDGPLFYMALERASGLVMVKGTLQDWAVLQSVPVEGVGAGAVVDAVALDPVLGALFVAFHPPGAPSRLYKFNATTLVVYGIKKMRNRGGPLSPSPDGLAQARPRALHLWCSGPFSVPASQPPCGASAGKRPEIANSWYKIANRKQATPRSHLAHVHPCRGRAAIMRDHVVTTLPSCMTMS